MLAQSVRSPRIGSREDYARLVRFSLVDLCKSLGCQCAAIVAAQASSPAEWSAVSADLRRVTDELRAHDAKGASKAAAEMGQGEPIAAALTLARVTGEELVDWHARITDDMRRSDSALAASVACGVQAGAVA